MTRKISITIIGSKDILSDLYENVKQYIYKPLIKECTYSGHGNLKVIMDEDSPGINYLLEMSERFMLHPYIAQWIEYTNEEIENSDFYEMRIPAPLELEGTDASDYGTQYNGGCSICGLGREPISDILIDRKFVKKYNIGTIYPEVFISEFMKEIIIENNLSGTLIEHELKDYKRRDIPKYYHMKISSILPPMNPTTWLHTDNSNGDKRCGHNIIYLRSDIQYDKTKLEGALDFNLTYEYLDNFRMRKLIVSAKTRKIFRNNRIYVAFMPITII